MSGPDATRRRWVSTTDVVAAIAFVTIGGRVVATALRDGTAGTLGLDDVVTVDPPAGWVEDEAARERSADAARFVLTKGSAVAVVTIGTGSTEAAPTVAERYVREALEARVLQLVARPLPGSVSVGGVPGVRVIYGGITGGRSAVEGLLTVAVAADGTALVIDAFAPEGSLAAVASDVAAMAGGARFG
jgi:hypothetical protein